MSKTEDNDSLPSLCPRCERINCMCNPYDDEIGMIDCWENNNMHGCLCDNLTCDCVCHEQIGDIE